MSEARHGLIRITSNYVRLLVTVSFGLILVRLLLRSLGNDAWGLIALLGSTVGIAAMLQEVVNQSMVRELGEAHHRGDPKWFSSVFNSALLLALAVAGISVLAMGIVWLIVPILRIPDELVGAGRFLVACKGVELFTMIAAAPLFNMFKVTERMTTYNAWLIAERCCFLTAAIWVSVVQPDDVAFGVMLYAGISSELAVCVKLTEVVVVVLLDRRLLPAPRQASRKAINSIVHIGGWNAATAVAINLHAKLDNVLMNVFFGLAGNLMFSLTLQLTGYVRMLTTGVTEGIDAVSARMSTAGATATLKRLLHHSTRLHGLVAMPAGLGLFVLAEPILVAWVGDRIQDPETTVAPTVVLIRIMAIGMVFRSIGDGWIGILYGAGHIRRYAPAVLLGGLANPLLAVGLVLLLPERVSYTGPVISFTAIFLLVHLLVVPLRAAQVLEVPFTQIVSPLIRPFVATAVCAPLLIAADAWVTQWTIPVLGLVILGFGGVYALVSAFVVLDAAERRRLVSLLPGRRA